MKSPAKGSSHRASLFPIILFLLAYSVYLKTSCKTIYLGDTPELATASYILGVAHPTGYPLFLLLGKLMTIIIPFGGVAFRSNLLSVICMALSTLLIYKISTEIYPNHLLGVFLALSASFTPTIWAEAGVSKVYILNLFFILLVFYLFLRFDEFGGARLFFTILFCLGLGLSNHIFVVVFLIPFSFLLFRKRYRMILNKRVLLVGLTLFFVGLSIYLYVPLRASSNPEICWGKPDNLQRFERYLTQQQYNVKKGARDLSDSLFLLKKWALLIPSEYGFFITILILLGAVGLFSKKRVIFLFLLGVVFINLVIVWFYGLGREFHLVYHIPVIVLLLFLVNGISMNGFMRKLLARQRTPYFIFLGVVILLFGRNYHLANRSEHDFGYMHGVNIMNTMERNSTFFGETDTALFPLYYLSFVEGYRKDIRLIDRQLNVAYFLEGNYARINPAEEKRIISESRVEVYYGEYPRIKGIKTTEYGLIHKVGDGDSGCSFSASDFVRLYAGFFEPKPEIYKDRWTQELRAIYYLLEGNFLRKDKLYDAALEAFDKAWKLGRNQIGILNNLSIYYEDMGEFERAASALDGIISSVKEEAGYEYIFKKGALFYRQKKYEKAEELFKEAAKARKKNTWTYYYLGNIYLLKADIQRAINNYKMSISINPKNTSSLMNLGVIYKKLGIYARAIESFKRALQISPGLKECYYNLAAIYSLSKDKDNSLYWLERGRRFFDNEMVQRCLAADDFEYLRGFPEFRAVLFQNRRSQ